MALNFAQIRAAVKNWRIKLDDLLWQPLLSEEPWWRRVLLRAAQITVAITRDLFQEQLSLRAMSLVFTTLIGFFPLFALTFAVLKSVGAHNAMEPTLMALLEPLGNRSTEVTQQILAYVDNLRVELIGITSVGLLLYIVLDMMRKIEGAFNYIWAVKQARSWASRISEYLFAVIVSPLLLFISISITSYVNTNFFTAFLEGLVYGGLIIRFFAAIAPILLMSLAFAFAYSFLPNTKVQFSSAFIGGLVTTLIWKLMGLFFQEFFVTSARESIYLAFASAIVIMFFIYVGWLVALIGSSIAFYHQYPAKTRTGRDKVALSICQRESMALAVAETVIEQFNQGGEPLNEEQIIARLHANPTGVESALALLLQIGMLTETSSEPASYLPTHSVTDSTLVDTWKALRNVNADEIDPLGNSQEMQRVREFQQQLDATIERELGDLHFAERNK
ncbi:MAG: YihY/virulence factor BrkB family protein [Pseudohongiellaceae bacterium]|jgi:membrane protein